MDFIAYSYGNINFYWYGLIITVAILCGLIISKLFFLLYKENFDPFWDLLLWSIPCSLIGARLGFVFTHMELYVNNYWHILYIWQGGVSIYGALIGFFLATIFYLQRRALNIWQWLDLMIPAILLGLSFVQIANFMMQVAVGTPLAVDLPNDHSLAEYVQYKYRPTGFESYQYFQPVSFYQATAYFFVFLLSSILLVVKKKISSIQSGSIFLWSIAIISIIRFIMGFVYFSLNKDIFLTTVQWITIFVFIAVVVIYLVKRQKLKKVK